jgi:hypothetical protein
VVLYYVIYVNTVIHELGTVHSLSAYKRKSLHDPLTLKLGLLVPVVQRGPYGWWRLVASLLQSLMIFFLFWRRFSL